MTGWKRSLHLSARLRRWMAIPKLEDLERREAPVSATVPIALLGAAALVRTAEPSSQTSDVEKSSAIADAAGDLSTKEDKALAEQIFSHSTTQGDSSPQVAFFLAATDQLSAVDDDAEWPTAHDAALDPVMAAGNALLDPVSHADSAPAKTGPHQAGPPTSYGINGPSPNLAGAYAGAGQGPGGASTPFTAGGGSSSGGGGGGAGGSSLATLANEGAFDAPTGAIAAATPTLAAPVAATPTPAAPAAATPPTSAVQAPAVRETPQLSGPPVANDDAYSMAPNTTISVPAASGVLANDTDPSGLQLTAVEVASTNLGPLQLNSDGSFTYTPNPGYVGTDSFQYYATDGQQDSNIATVTITIGDNGTITTQPDNYSVLHDQVLNVPASTGLLANDNDSDGDTLTASLYMDGQNGRAIVNSDGSFTYTPNPGYVGSDSFWYTASDGVSTSAATEVDVDVTDNAPVASNRSYSVPENTAVSVPAATGLLQGASDADGDPLTASLYMQAQNGTATVNPDGSFTYTPDSGYVGGDSFTYEVSDGALTTTATVTLNVHAGDTAPVANPDGYTSLHDQVLSVPASTGVLANDTDADGDPLTATKFSDPTQGSLQFNNDGSFTYTPDAGYTGTDSFQYTASDGQLSSSPATVTLTINDPNAPVAVADSYEIERNNEFDADSSTGVLANDSDADGDTLTAAKLSDPTHGMLTFNSDGSFSYVPDSGYTGTDSFTYEANDGVLNSQPATVTLTVSASPPSAANQSFAVLQNTALNAPTGSLLLNDGNPDNMTLTAQDVTQPQHGTVMVNSDGSFAYTPTSGFTGTDSFTYDLTDGSLTSDPATVTITVKASNTAPTATDLSYSVDENTSLSTDTSSGVLSGASDADGDPLLAVLVSGTSDGDLTLNLDGSFTYTPNADFFGTDSFQYKVFDGTTYSSPATVTLTVNEDVPAAVNDSYSVLTGGPTSVTADNGVLANDSDPDGATLTAVVESQPSYGSMQLNSDGSFTYTPNGSFTGSDSFTYEAYNDTAYSAVATVMLTSGPVATAQQYSVTHDQTLSVDAADGLLDGANDADGDTLTAALATGASDGNVMVNSDGSFTYTPYLHFVGTDSFTYTVSDGTNTSAPATVTIDVADDAPIVGDDNYSVHANTTLTVAAPGLMNMASDEDDFLPSSFILESGPSYGTFNFKPDGTFVYTPNTNFVGTDTFTYEGYDGALYSNIGTVTITVYDQAPFATPDSYNVAENGSLNGTQASVLQNDYDPDGDPLTAVLMSGPSDAASFVLNADGTFK